MRKSPIVTVLPFASFASSDRSWVGWGFWGGPNMRSGCHAKWCPRPPTRLGMGERSPSGVAIILQIDLDVKKPWRPGWLQRLFFKVVLQDPLVFRNPGCSQRFLDWSTNHKMLRFRKTWIESKGFSRIASTWLDHWLWLKPQRFPSTDQLNQPSPQGKCLMTCLSKLNTVGWFSRTLIFWLK